MSRARVRAVVLAVIGLVGTIAVRPADAATTPNYVALGDSHTAGPLIPMQVVPYGCLRSDNNYPHLLSDRLPDLELRDVSCSGAETDDMTQPQSVSAGPSPPQFGALDAGTESSRSASAGTTSASRASRRTASPRRRSARRARTATCGPDLFPANFRLLQSLRTSTRFLGPGYTGEHRAGSGQQRALDDVADDVSLHLVGLCRDGAQGRRPCSAASSGPRRTRPSPVPRVLPRRRRGRPRCAAPDRVGLVAYLVGERRCRAATRR